MLIEQFVSKYLHKVIRRDGPHSTLDLSYGYVTHIEQDPNTSEMKANVVWQRPACGLNKNNARWYSKAFMCSKGIQLTSLNVYDIKNKAFLRDIERERVRVNSEYEEHEKQYDLDLPDPVESKRPDENPGPAVYIVVRTSDLKPATIDNARLLQHKMAMDNPGEAFTLLQMLTHAKFPTKPYEVKA